MIEVIAAMPDPDRALGERLHAVIKASAPALAPKLWYGMPYTGDGKVVHEAALDEGAMWPTAFALKESTADEETRGAALVEKAVI